jgi:hypothetical protein
VSANRFICHVHYTSCTLYVMYTVSCTRYIMYTVCTQRFSRGIAAAGGGGGEGRHQGERQEEVGRMLGFRV